MSRPSAGDRLRRLLALLPWLADHPGSTITEIGERFGIKPETSSSTWRSRTTG
jgi:hypothetical protein